MSVIADFERIEGDPMGAFAGRRPGPYWALEENRMARPRFAVMTMTDRAAERARGLIANAATPVLGLRIGVEKGGCAGMSYSVAFAEAKQSLDEIVEEKGVTLFIDSKALMFLLGTELDFEAGKIASTFTFKNPNQVSACGCGESVSINPAALPEREPSHL